MSDNAMCACRRIEYRPVGDDGVGWTERWVCVGGCGSEFVRAERPAEAEGPTRALVAELEAEVARLKAELATLQVAASVCPRCKDTGVIAVECSFCGDSTYDHYCDDRDVACPSCGGAGTTPESKPHPAAAEQPAPAGFTYPGFTKRMVVPEKCTVCEASDTTGNACRTCRRDGGDR